MVLDQVLDPVTEKNTLLALLCLPGVPGDCRVVIYSQGQLACLSALALTPLDGKTYYLGLLLLLFRLRL